MHLSRTDASSKTNQRGALLQSGTRQTMWQARASCVETRALSRRAVATQQEHQAARSVGPAASEGGAPCRQEKNSLHRRHAQESLPAAENAERPAAAALRPESWQKHTRCTACAKRTAKMKGSAGGLKGYPKHSLKVCAIPQRGSNLP